MSHRIQVMLSDAQYLHLKQESRRTGVGLGELVRRAVAAVHGVGSQQTEEVLGASFGSWTDGCRDGEACIDQLRRGMGRRLAR